MVAQRDKKARRLPGREQALTNSDGLGYTGIPGPRSRPSQGECDMRMPPVSDRIKEAPAQALRGVFAGIGQLLLITDKLRNKTLADQHVPSARVPEPAESVAEADGLTVIQEPTAASAAGVTEAAGAGA